MIAWSPESMSGRSRPVTLTVSEAAGVLGVSRSSAYALVADGALPSVRLGRRLVVPVARLAELLSLSLEEMQAALSVSTPVPASQRG